jgi:hypothetical protein
VSYAAIWRLAVREATRVEEQKAEAWRREQTRKEREAIKRGELDPRDAFWTKGEKQ